MRIKKLSYNLALKENNVSLSLLPEITKLASAEKLLQTERRINLIFQAIEDNNVLKKIVLNKPTVIVFNYGTLYTCNAAMTIHDIGLKIKRLLPIKNRVKNNTGLRILKKRDESDDSRFTA